MTRGRVGKQTTLKSIPPRWLKDTHLICPEEETSLHGHQTIPVPAWVDNYSKKFQWILDGKSPTLGSDSRVVIMDDDLVFSKKIMVGDKVSLKTITDPEEIASLFDDMDALLNKYPLVGVHPRQMGQNAPT